MPNIVYVLTNPAMPGMVKIGMTDRDVQSRMKQLYDTGVPLPFECVIAWEIEDRDAGNIESALHRAFGPYRVNSSREFFEIGPEQAEALLRVMPGRDLTPGAVTEAAEDREASSEFKQRQARISEEDFFRSLDENGEHVFRRVLDLGNLEGMSITWARESFSLRAASDRVWIVICRGYRGSSPGPFNASMYTDFAVLAAKTGMPEAGIETLRQRAIDTGLFVSAGRGRELRCTIDHGFTEQELDALLSFLRDMAGRIQTSETQDADIDE